MPWLGRPTRPAARAHVPFVPILPVRPCQSYPPQQHQPQPHQGAQYNNHQQQQGGHKPYGGGGGGAAGGYGQVVGPYGQGKMDANMQNQANAKYMDMRDRARKEGEQMGQCFDKSKQAYARGGTFNP